MGLRGHAPWMDTSMAQFLSLQGDRPPLLIIKTDRETPIIILPSLFGADRQASSFYKPRYYKIA